MATYQYNRSFTDSMPQQNTAIMAKEGDDGYDVKNVHETFAEKSEVLKIIESLKEIQGDMIPCERAMERFTIDEYQEQPHLIDPYLEEIVNSIIDKARQPECEEAHMYLLFTCLHLLTKMRGYKVIVRYLPHEVSDVETVLDLLSKQNPDNFATWQNRYCLLLWLSMVSMIPFDLVRLDNTQGDGDNKLPVMDRILNLGKLYLFATDKSCDAAAYMLAKFLTRPDVKQRRLADTVDWALGVLKQCSEQKDTNLKLNTNAMIGGTLKMLALLFKNGKREDLIPYAGKILQFVVHDPIVCWSPNSLIRKLGAKLIQRIGLIYLKAKVAAWRYNRGSRSLAENLAKVPKTAEQSSASSTKTEGEEEDEDYDIPDEIEEVIEHLLKSLKDPDTIVRWSAAKGIGRIAGRLPKELAEDVVGALLQLFTLQETDAAWHGGCLSLAELGRRGLLLPQFLPEVIPNVIKSLNYDEKKGFFSVGSHVRDAACYVCWSFARAYEPEVIKEYVVKIASALLVATVFDREVNVRRAASAAFQENVGRQGTFPHGIDIVTTCDYFAVGLKSTAYLELSKFVAGFAEYTHPLIDHLVNFKIRHWDSKIRELSAKALFSLVPLDPVYFRDTVLPTLIPISTGTDLNARNGSMMAIGKVCLALRAENHPVTDPQCLTAIAEIEPKLREKKQLLGLGGEMMRTALCSMINDISESNMFPNDHSVIGVWQTLLDECLGYTEVVVQEAAIKSLNSFLKTREDEQQRVPDNVKGEIIKAYSDRMFNAGMENIRIGCALALGALPRSYLEGNLNQVLSALIHCSRVTDEPHNKHLKDTRKDWAESRRDAFKSIERICWTVGISAEGSPADSICRGNIDEIYDAYLIGLQDYTIDSRGDAGAWVREVCMTAVHSLTAAVVVTAPELLNREYVESIFMLMTQQACEKIDRTRDFAGTTFTKLLYMQPEVPHVPCRKELEQIFPQADIEAINFASPSVTFPRFSKLLDMEQYRYNILLGFTVSVGGLTESLVKHSHQALLTHIEQDQEKRDERVRQLSDTIILIFNKNKKVDRVTVPLLKMNSQLLASGVFDDLLEDNDFEFPVQLLECIKTEISKSGDPQKLLVSSEVLCGLLSFEGAVREKCLFQLAIFLCHRFPIVRKTTANSLFESLITIDDIIDEEKSESIQSMLTDTEWGEPVEKLKPLRNEMCELLGVKTPVAIKKKAAA